MSALRIQTYGVNLIWYACYVAKIIIGGCMLSDEDQQWQCFQCQLKIYKTNFSEVAQSYRPKEVIRFNEESTKQLIAKEYNLPVECILIRC